MRKLFLLAPFLLAMSWQDMYVRINGIPTFVGTLAETAGTPKDNSTTAVAFTLAAFNCYRVQCAAAAKLAPVAVTAFTTANAEVYQANQFAPASGAYCFQNANIVPKITVDFVAGTSTCVVQRMDPL